MRPVLIAIAIFGAILTGCSSNAARATVAHRPDAVPIQIATVSIEQWPVVYQATGTVRARASVVLASKLMAYVEQVDVQVGDRVREGQLLVTLDSQDLDTNVHRTEAAEAEALSAIAEADNGIAAAKANLDLAQTTFKRMEKLAAEKSISSQEFDEVQARVKSAQAAYDMARAKRSQLDSRLAQVRQEVRAATVMRGYTRIPAPFSGIVTTKSVEPGTLAAPGAPLLTIEREGSYRLEAAVEESKLPQVKLGQAVTVALEALDRRFNARVSEIVPAVDEASRSYTVKIDLPALPNLRSGMFGRAFFTLGSRNVTTVPAAAVAERGQLQSVFVVEDGFAHSRLVTVGTANGNEVEVLSGLTEHETVVSPALSGLSDGARAEVRQ